MTNTQTPSLVLYYRDYCHLCEHLANLLHTGWPDYFEQIELRNVDSQAEWLTEYGPRVPVLLSDGDLISELAPDLNQIREHFGPPANPL